MFSLHLRDDTLPQLADTGERTALDADLRSRERPLAGRYVALTWSPEEGPVITAHLEAAGAHVTPLFAGAIEPVRDTTALDAALRQVSRYDWVVLTSLSGVDALAQRLAALGMGPDVSRHVYIAMLFPMTALARQLATVPLHLVPAAAIADDIEAGLRELAGKRLLLLRAEHLHGTLAELLRLRGAEVDEVSAYRMVAHAVDTPSLERALAPAQTDAIAIICTSAVMADGLLAGLAALGRAPSEALRSIPLITLDSAAAATLRHAGLAPAVAISSPSASYAAVPSLRALVETLVAASSREAPLLAAPTQRPDRERWRSGLSETDQRGGVFE